MLDTLYLPVLLAQEKTTEALAQEASPPFFESPLGKFVYVILVLVAVFVAPFVLGHFVASAVRMRDYGLKLGVIFMSLFLGIFMLIRAYDFENKKFDIPLGVDLKGGVILIYEINAIAPEPGEEATGQPSIPMGDLVKRLSNRINPSGTKEIVIRPYGERQIEIIIPEVETQEVEEIKRRIETAGQLQFRIVANRRDHQGIIDVAVANASPESPTRFERRIMIDAKDEEGRDIREQVGFWAEAAKEKLKASQLMSEDDAILRDARTGEIIKLLEIGPIEGDQRLDEFLKKNYSDDRKIENLDILLATDDGCNVTGKHLGVVSAGTDEYLNPCVNFRMKSAGSRLFSHLTSANRPDMEAQPSPFYRHLGIMLDGRLLSFPRLITTITESGRITGDFKKEEVEFLVGILRAGSLPATLSREPISENQIGSMLGDDTIRKGKVSIVISLIAVLIFVAIYYRFSGLVACAALLMNLVLIMGLMVMLNAPLTLPGLAGLVLTIGMSVDANVLIFERIREELNRGAALRMAIRNGFARATTTIVDANVTTLITAAVLYVIGTDQIRGFAVTLILGIVMSMYTAIFCSRVVFDIAERRRWITELKMMRLLGATKLDFLGKRRIAIAGSIVLILLGLAAVVSRGREIFDIDFNGGLSVTMVLQESESPDDVRRRLNEHFQDADPPVSLSVNTVSIEGRDPNTVYKIDADIQDQDIELLENAIRDIFRDESGASQLQAYSMDFGSFQEKKISLPGAARKEGGEENQLAEDPSGEGAQPGPGSETQDPDANPTTDTEDSGEADSGEADSGEADSGEADSGEGDGSEGDGSEGDGSEGDGSEGDGSEGDGSEGDGSEGDGSEGDGSEGDGSEGDGSEGDGSEGDGSEGDGSEGDGSEGDGSEGDGSEGDGSEGDGSEGDGSEGDGSEGDGSEGDGSEGDGSEGDGSEGDGSEGDGSEGDGSEGDGSEGDSDEGATSFRRDLPSDSLLALAEPGWIAVQDEEETAGGEDATAQPKNDENEADAEDETSETVEADPAKPDAAADDSTDEVTESEDVDATAATVKTVLRTEVVLTLGDKINTPTLREKIQIAYTQEFGDGSVDANEPGAALMEVPGLRVAEDDSFNWEQDNPASREKWYVRIDAPQTNVEQVLTRMQQDLENTPVFPSSSKIGGKVAGDTQNLAIAALIASLFGIVGYIWIRFQRVVFGVAAVIALVHDVLITLGAIAISAYLAKPLGFLLIDEFRISLPIVAAFLTIIGYSLNDTIVVFDRIREVRGKSPDLTAEMINTSINQTLSRTLLTSLTTLIVVAILYAIGGQGIHGFAFALVIGVLVGTYSSVFIASPALLWLFNINRESN